MTTDARRAEIEGRMNRTYPKGAGPTVDEAICIDAEAESRGIAKGRAEAFRSALDAVVELVGEWEHLESASQALDAAIRVIQHRHAGKTGACAHGYPPPKRAQADAKKGDGGP